jgi:hypothetical protein
MHPNGISADAGDVGSEGPFRPGGHTRVEALVEGVRFANALAIHPRGSIGAAGAAGGGGQGPSAGRSRGRRHASFRIPSLRAG